MVNRSALKDPTNCMPISNARIEINATRSNPNVRMVSVWTTYAIAMMGLGAKDVICLMKMNVNTGKRNCLEIFNLYKSGHLLLILILPLTNPPVRPCDVFAHCTNTLGSFYCTCMPGYDGDGFTCHGR